VADRQTRPVTGRRACSGTLILALAVLLGGCVPADPDDDTYLGKVSVTLGAALSEVATVRTVLEMLQDGKMFRSTAIVQVRESQSSLDTNAGAFNEINPPPDLDPIYTETNSLLSNATDSVEAARLAIHRHQVGSYSPVAEHLGEIADKLDALEARAS
jgi:hypothetical protein